MKIQSTTIKIIFWELKIPDFHFFAIKLNSDKVKFDNFYASRTRYIIKISFNLILKTILTKFLNPLFITIILYQEIKYYLSNQHQS